MSNVVALPTAAPSKVRQPAGRSCRRYMEARNALPQFPMDRVFEASPYVKRCREQAELMLDSGEAAIMQMALAVMSVMDDQQRFRVMGRLIALSALKRPGAEEALAWVNYEAASKSRKQDIDMAARYIAAERGLEGLGK